MLFLRLLKDCALTHGETTFTFDRVAKIRTSELLNSTEVNGMAGLI
jgi:hypothetical protein